MHSSPIEAWKIYWHKVLTPQGQWLFLLQLSLLSAQLLLPGVPVPGWLAEPPATAFQPSFAGMEAALLGAFLVQWCTWSELLYGLRLRFQPAETVVGSPWRRFALHIYGGFVFLFVLSALANLQPLLGVGAMFLLFMGGEAQEKEPAQQSIPMDLIKGMRRSYQLISYEPWRFLISLILPGLVLYAGGVVIVWMRLVGVPWILIGLAMALWLVFFLLAQLKVALRAEGELDVDVLMGKESLVASQTPNSSQTILKALLEEFDRLCNVLATLLGLVCCGWLLLKLGEAGLLSTHALAMAFGSMVSLLSGTVSALLSLLVRLAFIAVVAAAIGILLVLIIGFGRPDPLRPLKKAADRLQLGLQRVGSAFSDLSFAKGATLGLGTLLTALGTVAVQSYDRVQKEQERLTMTREALYQQQKMRAQKAQSRLMSNEALVTRIQERVREIRKATDDTVKSELLQQLHSELRDVLPELRLLNGAVDGQRKGKILRYLYESELLDSPDRMDLPDRKKCDAALSLTMRELPTMEVKDKLKKKGCGLDLFLHSMDFSKASLENAYLKNAFLPFINLKYANLRGARLNGAMLRYADLENADLTNSDLSNTDLSHSNIVGANFTGVPMKGASSTSVKGALAFYAVSDPSHKQVGEISWDLLKGSQPGRGERNGAPYWTFCPLDTQSTIPTGKRPSSIPPPLISQGGAKCRNRLFDAQTDNNLVHHFSSRDWSGSSFHKSTLKGMTFEGISLAGADLSEGLLEDMTLKNVSFAGANLQNTVLKESVLVNVDLTGANLKGFRIERPRLTRNTLYQGSLIQLGDNKSMTPYVTAQTRQNAYDARRFEEQDIDDFNAVRQGVLAPLLMAPFPLRPQHLLYWMVATPSPGALIPHIQQP